MSAIVTNQPIKSDVLAVIDRNPRLQPSIKHRNKKAIRGNLDTDASLTDAAALTEYTANLPQVGPFFPQGRDPVVE
jgi:hypothetical protein